MPQAVICAYARTPFGKHRGALSGYSATELGAMAVKELLERAGIDPASGVIDQVYMGHVLQTGSGQAPARQAAMNAGLPVTTPCTSVNKVCGSSLKAAMIAATEIRAGVSRMVIAGGMESMSNAPHFVRRARRGEEVSYAALESVLVHDGLKDAYTGEAMGNAGETIAGEHSISREQSDAFAIRSHALANKAWDEGWLDKESFPVGGLERDEGIRPDSSMDSLSGLRTVFSDGGQITAGNSSQVSDGASAVLVASEEAAEEHGLPVLARIIDYATSGVESHRVMSAPIPTVRNLLKRNGMSMDDIDILEHNEAFAAASCAIQMVLGVSEDRFNPHGGAVAIGHPLGATGTRCLMTLVNALERIGGHRGIVTICLGGGNAVAMLVERD
ncbi:MAG: acetyl-CoA C-acyltransferase [Candidatus Thalassarchaeum betae]|uniref:Acetyl-CoA C-acyltransferase n=1 Tax=Candidatus Thalassarchaeum betae TaxID=2599289 RepID=A0A2V3HR90_9ARCH|nr:MAG: acetyl-CoA C-acyltransferase [Candidatus Thalassoarchaea betae]PXF26085.1 MAG: acetyl-CoA C-acyltransferase [Euryarchaeota archaeon]HIM13768.1 thiolase family protein [Candidatus Poseidoniales archaeon]HIM92609.1 thiolase family protein [Candidatus Poseidoniales archaeon]